MELRAATPDDAQAISALVLALSDTFYIHPDRTGAEAFIESVSEAAQRRYIAAANFRFLVAHLDGQLVGVAALRDGAHLFHLFVSASVQRCGLARQLWNAIACESLNANLVSRFTVNASLNAIPVYERFGFQRDGPMVQARGVSFQPMVMDIHTRSNTINDAATS